MKDYTVYVVKEKDTGRYFRERSIVHGLRVIDWTYRSDRAFKVDCRAEAEVVVDQLTADGYDVDIYVHSKGFQARRPYAGILRRAAWSLMLLVSITGEVSCGRSGWDEMRAERIPIFGEPVDEEAVLDAVATVMGVSDMSEFAFWFTLEDLPAAPGKETRGRAHLCTRKENIEIHMDRPGQCVFDTSLVHELMHRWDLRVRGRSCAEISQDLHPVKLFGRCGDGGLVGKINDHLREKHCPGSPKPPMRICAVDG